MIGFFPEPYEDELFFSMCSRYHWQTGYPGAVSSSLDLFGLRRVRMAPDLPCHVASFIERLPPGHRYSISRIVNHHTLLPFYAPFVPHERALGARKGMAEHHPAPLHGRLGINTTKCKWEFLRYCSGCVEADRERYGETYWHRLPQVPGLEACPVHRARLRNSAVPLRHSMGREVFITAEKALADCMSPDYNEANTVLPAQLEIAKSVAWLLSHPESSGYTSGHRQRYIGLLFERGLATYNGTLNTRTLTEQVVAHYSSDFLTTLGCMPRDWPHRSWISELVSGYEHTHPPLQHLLLIQFLGLSVKDFLELPEKRLPFGKAPWPCLNRASNHFRQDLIWKCQLSPTQRNGRRPRGCFRCSCGFSYSRIGPDESKARRFVIDRYLTFGKEFRERVRALLDEGHSRREIAKQLGLALGTLGKLIRNMRSSKNSIERERVWKRRTIEETKQLRVLNRKLLLDALSKWPEAGRCEIHRRLAAPYNWLYKNDRPWLLAQLPPHKPKHGPPDRIKWNQKDIECVAGVRAEAERIRTLGGRPVRISSTLIARNLKIIEIVSKRSEKLPLTVRALQEVAESADDYATRRIIWVGRCYREEGISPAAWQVGARAGLRWNQSKSPRFKPIIDEIVNQLNDQISLRYA